ncbi:MAG: hypothetical protein EXS00_05485 [Phycisphaerales bacterium]|nr:hypothetical protein [Phycisphaerales bacterium]
MLANRLQNRFRHLRKWARRSGVQCFRVYERDIPEFPVIVDWYDGDVVAWIHPRRKDETIEQEVAFLELCQSEVIKAFALQPERLFIKERQRQRGMAQYERAGAAGQTRTVMEQGLKFEVNLTDYLDTGLFLDHRMTRQMVRQSAAGKRVLNLFAYTGAFTVYAAAGGALRTVTIDMSNTYLAWCQRNLLLNEVEASSIGVPDAAQHQIIHADCLAWLDHRPNVAEQFDIVVCDPPTFSNSKRMRDDSFSVDRDWSALLASIVPCVAPGGVIYFSTNSRSFSLSLEGLPPGWSARDISRFTQSEDFSQSRNTHRCWILGAGEQAPLAPKPKWIEPD